MNFVKEDGIWKIGKFWLHFDTSAFLAPDWSSNPPYRCVDKKELPDLPSTSYHPFPEVNRIPFQYPNPVTGEMIPGYTDPTHYWIGNWPGEFNKDSVIIEIHADETASSVLCVADIFGRAADMHWPVGASGAAADA
jgi:hypothetical protein